MTFLLIPRNEEEEKAQLRAAIQASIQDTFHQDEERNERETLSDRISSGNHVVGIASANHHYVRDTSFFLGNFLYPQRRLQQAQGEFC